MSAEVENIFRSFWEWRLKESPEFATQIGVHTYDKSLDDHSLGAYAKRQVLKLWAADLPLKVYTKKPFTISTVGMV